MTNLSQIMFLLTVVASTVSAKEWYEQRNPHFLTQSTFYKLRDNQKDIKILKFFSPTCRYCKISKPYFDHFKEVNRYEAKFYEINCKEQKDLCKYFQISLFPTVIFLWDNNKFAEEISGYYADDVMEDWMYDILGQMQNFLRKHYYGFRRLQTVEPEDEPKEKFIIERSIQLSQYPVKQGKEIANTTPKNDTENKHQIKDSQKQLKIMGYLGILFIGIIYFIRILPKNQNKQPSQHLNKKTINHLITHQKNQLQNHK